MDGYAFLSGTPMPWTPHCGFFRPLHPSLSPVESRLYSAPVRNRDQYCRFTRSGTRLLKQREQTIVFLDNGNPG
jgi:hypothetical protein